MMSRATAMMRIVPVPAASVLRPALVASDRVMKTTPTAMTAAVRIQAERAKRARIDRPPERRLSMRRDAMGAF
jgi:hypothetical protein